MARSTTRPDELPYADTDAADGDADGDSAGGGGSADGDAQGVIGPAVLVQKPLLAMQASSSLSSPLGLALPPPTVLAPRPVYSTVFSIARVSQPPSNPQNFIQLPPTPPPYAVEKDPFDNVGVGGSDSQQSLGLGAQGDESSSSRTLDPQAFTQQQQQQQHASGIAALRSLMKDAIPIKAKLTQYDFEYNDRDTFESEMNEFFNFQDNPFIQEGRKIFESSFEKEWLKESDDTREEYIAMLLDCLELKRPDVRYAAAKQLLYIAQGVFGECRSFEEQISWIRHNNNLLLKCDAFCMFHQALRVASTTLDAIHRTATGTAAPSVPDQLQRGRENSTPEQRFLLPTGEDPASMSSAERQSAFDMANAESAIYLSLCYVMIETCMESSILRATVAADRDGAGRSAKKPNSIAADLFELVTSLAEGNRKNYPVKKLLLLLWKVLLITMGTKDQLRKIRDASRRREGLTPTYDGSYLKSTPQDLHNFDNLTTLKYPAYYHPIANPKALRTDPTHPSLSDPSCFSARRTAALAATPLLQPLLEPLPPSVLPRAMGEAVDILSRHAYVPLSSVQMAREKEMFEMWANGDDGGWKKSVNAAGKKRRRKRVQKIEDGELGLDAIESLYSFLAPNMTTHVGMLVRLLFFLNIGNNMPPGTQVDGTSDQHGGDVNPPLTPTTGKSLEGLTAEQRREILDRFDINRHKEVVTKALSAILLILLKASKCDHALKSEYISQILMDTNCAILILKILSTSFQNAPAANSTTGHGGGAAGGPGGDPAASLPVGGVTAFLREKEYPTELNFFTFCNIPDLFDQNYISNRKSVDDEEEAEMVDAHESSPEPRSPCEVSSTSTTSPSQSGGVANSPAAASDIPRSITSSNSVKGSWRNFFTSINLLRVLQKMTKRKTHRLMSLVQWKAGAVLKRVIKVNHPALQLYALKLLKSQIPFLGRKWRGSNMKVITAIFMHLRPYVKEDYLSEMEVNVDDVVIEDSNLRRLVAYFHYKNFPGPNYPAPELAQPDMDGQNNDGSSQQRSGQQQSHHGHRLSLGGSSTLGQSLQEPDDFEILLNLVKRQHIHNVSSSSVVLGSDSGSLSGSMLSMPGSALPSAPSSKSLWYSSRVPADHAVRVAHAIQASLPPPGKNLYRERVERDLLIDESDEDDEGERWWNDVAVTSSADGEWTGLDRNFMETYDYWLRQEVYDAPGVADSVFGTVAGADESIIGENGSTDAVVPDRGRVRDSSIDEAIGGETGVIGLDKPPGSDLGDREELYGLYGQDTVELGDEILIGGQSESAIDDDLDYFDDGFHGDDGDRGSEDSEDEDDDDDAARLGRSKFTSNGKGRDEGKEPVSIYVTGSDAGVSQNSMPNEIEEEDEEEEDDDDEDEDVEGNDEEMLSYLRAGPAGSPTVDWTVTVDNWWDANGNISPTGSNSLLGGVTSWDSNSPRISGRSHSGSLGRKRSSAGSHNSLVDIGVGSGPISSSTGTTLVGKSRGHNSSKKRDGSLSPIEGAFGSWMVDEFDDGNTLGFDEKISPLAPAPSPLSSAPTSPSKQLFGRSGAVDKKS